MDLEAMQLLNLSPIPELSEIELSTMLDHLSGLSDINGDLTDRNVEDIIKEAEDLLDRSMNSQINEMREVEKSPKKESDVISQDSHCIKDNNDCNIEESSLGVDKPSTNSVHDLIITHNSPNEDDCNKHFNSPVESPQSKVYSPVGPINHIKSTIDSLKEFTTLVEKKLSSQSENSSPKSKNENKATAKADNQKVISKKNELDSPKIVQSPDLSIRESKSLSKSIKLLNCFERLYQVRPVRFAAYKKPKVIDKTPKATVKKKVTRDVKTFKKSNRQVKSVPANTVGDIVTQKNWSRSPQSGQDLFLKEDTKSFKCFQTHNVLEMKPTGDKTKDDILAYKCLDKRFNVNIDLGKNQSRIDENLIVKVLEEVEIIKDDVQKGTTGNEPENAVDNIKTNEKKEENVIQRLEAQFAALKDKYDYQMEKLEAENLRLREALVNREKFFPQEDEIRSVPIETGTRSVSLESCEGLKNSLSPENAHTVKEAFSQTEENEGTREEDVKRTENKENVVGLKKKLVKCKPFADINAKQKKTVEHDTQLLATLRGLQAEATAKDKENRKLKSELESLRKQLKKATGVRVENCKRCNVGTQTIGLGPVVQKPYNPENYEVPDELEKENEDLRSRVKALEEDFELLKEKRISDLQALHQVHEEEMAKLVSKLETQSALTRHLHSLLVNR